MRIVRPVVINEPREGYSQGMSDPDQHVYPGGLGSQLGAVDGLPLDAGRFGEADLGNAAPASEAAQAAADGEAFGEDVGLVGCGWQHPFTLV